MAKIENSYKKASVKTASNLKSVAHSMGLEDLSRLSLPEIDAVVDQVSQVVPAGNVPGVILNGLARLSGRNPPPKKVKRDINLLFRGVGQTLDKAMYGTLFAGPAAVIWGYQNLLKLAGKDPEDSFPEGTWQFYLDYALREDTARHCNEFHGFDTDLKRYDIELDEINRITAWTMTAISALHQYDALLENEWRERVYTYKLYEIALAQGEGEKYVRLSWNWAKQRPYRRENDAGQQETYPAYRRRKFDEFLQKIWAGVPATWRSRWEEKIRTATEEDLPLYQQQMSILAYLDPDTNGETRTPISLKKAHVGIIHQGRYYLIPACAPRSDQMADVETVRAQVATLIKYPSNTKAVNLIPLARTKRAAWPELRKKFSRSLLQEFDLLRLSPILINCERRPRDLPLAELRQGERGIGDHPLTIFDTGETFVMDQSHIFFDGAWGAALAEILANEALSWAVYLSSLPPVQTRQSRPHALTFKFQPSELDIIAKIPKVTLEANAETDKVKLKPILRLRRLFKRRNDLIQLTVNDLLILYRAIHAVTYQPDPELIAELEQMKQTRASRQAATAALEALSPSKQRNPAIVIPVDASQRVPRDRLYPLTFEVPLHELDLLETHQHTMEALDGYKSGSGDRTTHYANFDKLQRHYLATLAGFGSVLSRTKEIAVAGKSASVGTIKLLAHMPTPLQRMLDSIPNRIDVLNDIIKGGEVFSNVGAVVPSSTLTRFLTAKDDNDKKTLAWGVITDAEGIMRISLRDFRPHIGLLIESDEKAVAIRLVQHYLDAYAEGLNQYIVDLQRITETSRETRMMRNI